MMSKQIKKMKMDNEKSPLKNEACVGVEKAQAETGIADDGKSLEAIQSGGIWLLFFAC